MSALVKSHRNCIVTKHFESKPPHYLSLELKLSMTDHSRYYLLWGEILGPFTISVEPFIADVKEDSLPGHADNVNSIASSKKLQLPVGSFKKLARDALPIPFQLLVILKTVLLLTEIFRLKTEIVGRVIFP